MKKLQIILTYCNNHLARKTILVEVGYDLWDNFALREKLGSFIKTFIWMKGMGPLLDG